MNIYGGEPTICPLVSPRVEVEGADLQNGLLVISLRRELPEALKPRKIQIGGKDDGKLIEQKSSRKAKAA